MPHLSNNTENINPKGLPPLQDPNSSYSPAIPPAGRGLACDQGRNSMVPSCLGIATTAKG